MTIVSFLIVNYNNFSMLRSVVDHLLRASPVPFEILIVDNASTDGDIREHLPLTESVKVIQNSINMGWPSAINIGIAHAQGTYICIVDNDVLIHDDTVQSFLRVSRAYGNSVIVSPVLRNANGTIQRSFRDFPSLWNRICLLFFLNIIFRRSPWFNLEHWNHHPDEGDQEVKEAMGACLFMHRSIIERNGLFDDAFFMYASDTDYCVRHIHAGGLIIRATNVRVTHFGSVSSQNIPYMGMKSFARDIARYYRKHFSSWKARCLLSLEMIIAAERALIWLIFGTIFVRQLWLRKSMALWVKSGIVASELIFFRRSM